MLDFLSESWLGALDERAQQVTLAGPAELQLEYTIGDVVYHVAFAGDTVRFRPGPAPDPAVRLVTDRAAAVTIARGETSAQRVFMNGGLTIEGDPRALVGALPAMRALDDIFAEIRADTDWGDA